MKRSLLAAAGIVVVTAAAFVSYDRIYLQRTSAKFGYVNTGRELTPVTSGDAQTILIAGSDRRHGDRKLGIKSRSDTMILVRVDPGKGMSLMSIPRDLKADIPGYGTERINAAYTFGGPRLLIRTVKQLTGLRINHFFDVNFHGFSKAVNALGCVYVDVDHRYFNDNSGFAPGGGYATINVKPGYQKLCGQKALDYARYRHGDTDIVRAARQQDFLRQLRDQLSTGKLIGNSSKLIDIAARNTNSDLRDKGDELRRLLRVGLGVADKPITQVKFHADLGPSFVTANPAQLRANVRQFLFVRPAKGGALAEQGKRAPNARHGKGSKSSGTNLADFRQSGKEQARIAYSGTGFKVFYPTKLAPGSSYTDAPRTYTIKGRDGRHRAYKMVIFTGYLGEYYGVMGTSWEEPPILAHPSEERTIRGREYLLFFNGDRLRIVGWKDDGKSYWISNTLLQTLSAKEMLGIARSMREYPR
ncbi:MAG: LCP family protein [Solirubrobacterales bacterium]